MTQPIPEPSMSSNADDVLSALDFDLACEAVTCEAAANHAARLVCRNCKHETHRLVCPVDAARLRHPTGRTVCGQCQHMQQTAPMIDGIEHLGKKS